MLVKAYTERIKREQEERITLTYLGAALQRAKKMPSLKELLKEDKKEMSSESMLEEVRKLNAAMGGITY